MREEYLLRRFFRYVALCILITVLETPASAEPFAVPGTGACENIVARLADAFNRNHPGDRITVPPSVGSGGGIKVVLSGEAPLARVARPLKEGEKEQGLVQVCFARDVIAFVVGSQVTVKNLRSEQLAAIFSGRIDNWKDVGGHRAPIRVISREPGDSSLIVIEKNLKEFHNLTFTPRAKMFLYDQLTVEAIAKYKNSIGFVTNSAMRWSSGGLRPISLNGVAPTRENALAGRYPLVEDYTFVYRTHLAPASRRFIEFVFSPAGREIINGSGLIAVDRR